MKKGGISYVRESGERMFSGKSIPMTNYHNDGSKQVILLVEGLTGKDVDYQEHFAVPLAEKFNVRTTELPGRGFASGKRMRDYVEDVVEKTVADYGAGNIVLVGNSLGGLVSRQLLEDKRIEPDGFYGLCTYPNIRNGGTVRNALSGLAERLDFSVLSKPTDCSKVVVPSRYCIPENDEVLGWFRSDSFDAYREAFEKEGASVYSMGGRNHCLNLTRGDLAPFNHGSPTEVVDDLSDFVDSLKGGR